MSAVALALGIAQLIGPKIIGLITGNKKGEAIAEKVIGIASDITHEPDAASAVDLLQRDKLLANQFRLKLADQEASLLEMAYKDRADARAMYQATNHETADKISQQVMTFNAWFVLGLVVINALAVYFLKDQAAVLATISNILGIVIKSLLDERKEVTGFYLGGSLDGREASTERRSHGALK